MFEPDFDLWNINFSWLKEKKEGNYFNQDIVRFSRTLLNCSTTITILWQQDETKEPPECH